MRGVVRAAAMGELHRRATNPARGLMLHLREVRAGRRLFRRFRAHMRALLDEARPTVPACREAEAGGVCRVVDRPWVEGARKLSASGDAPPSQKNDSMSIEMMNLPPFHLVVLQNSFDIATAGCEAPACAHM